MQYNPDAINPSHYKGEIQCIDAMRAASTKEEFKGFLRLTAMKYLWRLGRKDHPIQEGQKAIWYIDKLIDEHRNDESITVDKQGSM